MAGAVAAASGESWAAFYNPAGLARLSRDAVSLDGRAAWEDVKNEAVSFSCPSGRGAWELAAGVLTVGGIERTRYDPSSPDRFTTDGSVRAGDQFAGAAYARRLSPDVDGGVGVKILSEKLDNRSARTVAFDAGVVRQMNDSWRWAAALLNAGPDARFDSQRFPTPVRLQLGVRCSPASWVDWEADWSDAFHGEKSVLLGGQFHPEEGNYFLRLGYRAQSHGNGLGDWYGATGGLGGRWGNIEADYSVQPFGGLGVVQQVSLSWRFGRKYYLSGSRRLQKNLSR